MPTNAILMINGKKIDADIHDVSLEQRIDGHHVLTATLRKTGQVEKMSEFEDLSEYRDFVGKPVSITFESDEIPGTQDTVRLEFVYVVTQVSYDNSYDGINTARITGHSPTYLMDGSKRNKIWQEQSASNIIKAILGNHSITQGTIETTAKNLSYCVQYHETDFEFIQRLAAANGMYAYYDGREFHVQKPTNSSPISLTWGYTLAAFTVGVGTAVEKFDGAGYCRLNKETYSGETSGSPRRSLSGLAAVSHRASKSLYPQASSIGGLVPESQAEIDGAVELARMASIGTMIQGKGNTRDVPLSVAQKIDIEGLGNEINDSYFITRVVHAWKIGEYDCSFVCTSMDAAQPALRPKPKATDLQAAIVTGTDDPENMGRVKVKFSWTVDGQQAEPDYWIRMITPHAGAERGFFALPELGDEVIVAFEGGDPDRPVILGCMWNGKDNPPTNHPAGFTAADNDLKVFRTKGNNDLIFVDKSGYEALSLVQKDGKNLITLTMDGPKIMIESEGDISIKGNTVTIETTSGDVEIKSGAKVSVTSTGDMELKSSGNLKAEGSMNFEGKGGTEAKLSGTTVKVEGTAMTEIKGGIVKIN
ncbi:MAG TPA: type VI secretion system Vgr family protein [candidate division Zixibacteria bacterium]|nr:type VI secretion system Vgr family protein [candidate division Zixibacteria bacterium]